jgi:sulfate adenylyltransferase/3'-phosphoadenosine 5'-phosphosulfate synthase
MEATAATKKTAHLIAPHGGELVDRTVTGEDALALAAEAETLPRVEMSDKQTADLDMIASGARRSRRCTSRTGCRGPCR